eukprot:1808395-Alexandrium_andersonii.AAC.1
MCIRDSETAGRPRPDPPAATRPGMVRRRDAMLDDAGGRAGKATGRARDSRQSTAEQLALANEPLSASCSAHHKSSSACNIRCARAN